MNDVKIPFSCGLVAWDHKPQKGREVVECQKVGHYMTIEATPEQIYKLICEGRCWRAGIFKEGALQTRDIDFIGSRLVALDFDKSDISPQEMVEYCQMRDIEPNFWYYSFSQGIKEKDNFRLVWVLDETISTDEYKELIIALLKDVIFNTADPACKNIGRLWFGTQNGGGFIKSEPIAFSAFDVFPREDKTRGNAKKKATEGRYTEQTETDETFIMPKYAFDWRGALHGVCDLWDKWEQKKYLKYYQRLLLFSELKHIKYDRSVRRSLLDEIMNYYDADLYADSKCDRAEIQNFLNNPKVGIGITNKLVAFNGKEYTIAEWFNSGDYLKRGKVKRQKRITREELKKEADEKIPDMLEAGGINYIECQTEAGKTERIINYLASQDLTKRKIIYSIPTYILIDEFIKRLRNKGISLDNVYCPRRIEYTKDEEIYLDLGFPWYVSVNNQMIQRRKELDMVEDEDKKGLFILTHSALTHLKKVRADKIIIDENIEDCLVKKFSIEYADLWTLKAFIYTRDEILKENNRNNVYIEGETVEEKISFIDSQIEAVNRDLDYIIEMVKTANPQTVINNIDMDRLCNYINGYRLANYVKDKNVNSNKDGTTLNHVGQLKNATLITVGESTYKDTRYLYFEIQSELLKSASERGISVSLLTGTPKLQQLKAGLSEDMRDKIGIVKIDRADPVGNVYQWIIEGASGSKSSIRRTFEYAIKELDKLEVDWTTINLLTLKEYRNVARERGFNIPQTEDGNDIYIENCAGIDSMKGQDLIVIGKVDIPKNAYIDMLHNEKLSGIQKRITRYIDDTGIEVRIYSFLENELWDLQSEQIRLPLEQAVGRARTLWYPCNVYVFCDYPVRNVKEPEHYIKGVR